MKTSQIISIVVLFLTGLAIILLFTKFKQVANMFIFAAIVCLGLAQLLNEEAYLENHMMKDAPASSALCWNQENQKVDPATVPGGCIPICVKGNPNDPCCPSDYNDSLWDGITCSGVKGEKGEPPDPAKLGQDCSSISEKGYVCTLVNSRDVKCPPPDPPDCGGGIEPVWDSSISPPCGGYKCPPPPTPPPNCGVSSDPNCKCPPCSSLSGSWTGWPFSGCNFISHNDQQSCGASMTDDTGVVTCCYGDNPNP